MSPNPRPLPMALTGCELDDRQLGEQLARYRHLSASVLRAERADLNARIYFDAHVDAHLLEETLAIERGCCSFFTLDYDSSDRVLSISTEPARAGALSVLLSALTPTGSGHR
jgi:hypothetical protein